MYSGAPLYLYLLQLLDKLPLPAELTAAGGWREQRQQPQQNHQMVLCG